MGIQITLDEIGADELYTMLVLEDERDQLDRERTPTNGQ